jgi:hypothetical protein
MLQREHLSSSKDSKQAIRRRYLAHRIQEARTPVEGGELLCFLAGASFTSPSALSFCPSCDAHLPRLVPEPMYGGSCYETASAGCSMYSDLPVPGATGRSRMKVRTPRGQMQPLKAPCLPGGPSVQCCAHLRTTTSGRRTHRSAVCARSARRAAAQVAPDTGTSAQAHTPGSRERLQSRAPAASRFPPAT